MLLATLLTCATLTAEQVKVHTIGDSTMQTYDENVGETRGWAQYLQQFFGSDVLVNNRGKAGASSKSFYREAAFWQSVKQQLSPGDYVLIQFAHNDEKNSGMDGDSLIAYLQNQGDATAAATTDYRGTTPWGTYKDYLRRYVQETLAAGCHPVLVGPICRMYFTGNDIRRNGRHDLGDSFSLLTADGVMTGRQLPTTDHTMDYVWQMQQVAQEADVPFVDLTTATANLYTSYGDAKCHELLSDGNGSTHLSAVGATLIARLAASLLQKAGILKDDITIPQELSVAPLSADFGEAYKGQVLTKEFSINGFALNPSVGTIAITAEGSGLEVSTDKNIWSSQASIDYADGTLVKSFYARLTLAQNGETTGNIKVQQGSTTIVIPVKAAAVSLEGGTTVEVRWPLETDDSYRLTGPAVAIPEQWEGMEVQRYANPNANTVWPSYTGYDSSHKTQRNVIVGGVWPEGEIDEVSTRYIQFGITPAAGTILKVDSLGLFVCGAGGNGMMCHVNYSTKPFFAEPQTLFAPTKMPANNMLEVTAQPVITLQQGDTLRLHVYPWYNGTATGKTICLSDVTIHGMAFDAPSATAVGRGEASTRTDEIAFYNLQGMRVIVPKRGIYIRNGKKYIK